MKWLDRLLSDGTDLSRRKFVKDAATLTALAVTAAHTPQLAQTLLESIDQQIRNGLVKGQTFWLTEPIIVDLPNVIFEDCTFIAENPMPYMMQFTERAKNCTLRHCDFGGRNMGDGCAIGFNMPRLSGGGGGFAH